jgi:hypothetical protein
MTDDWETTPEPASVTAEQAVLGAILAAGMSNAGAAMAEIVAREAFVIVRPEMFWRPGHATIAALILAMVDAGVPVDPQTVLARLTAAGETARVGGAPYLHTLSTRGTPGNVDYYAAEVRDCYVRRCVQVEARRVLQRVSAPGAETADLVAQFEGAARAVAELAVEPATLPPPRTLTDLLAGSDTPDWIIPGLLERRERVIITGFEGLGKSELSAQVALCAAAGIHPFTGQPGDPCRVLVVDLENGEGNMRRRYRRIAQVVTAIGGDWDHGRLMVEIREQGVDLRQGDDVAWLDRLLTAGRPDVLVIGSLYKMHRDDPASEQAARHLVHTLDTLRVKHGVALLIEAHAGHSEEASGRRKLRPRGSSLFLGWPNVGIGLRPHQDAVDMEHPNLVEVKHWRGDREAREWPKVLARSGDGAYGLPWTSYTPTTADKAAARLRRAELQQGGAA